MDLVQKMYDQVISKMPAPTTSEQTHIDIGREFGTQFIDALRAGKQPSDFLMAAVFLAGKTDQVELRGFFRELQEFIEETAP